MGARIARYNFVPKENEQIDTVITLEEDIRSVIHGVVKDCKGRYIKDAVVKLFRVKELDSQCDLKSITHTFTDECGQFLFGPLTPGKKYVVKVWANDVKPSLEDEPKDNCPPAEPNERADVVPKKKVYPKDSGNESYYRTY